MRTPLTLALLAATLVACGDKDDDGGGDSGGTDGTDGTSDPDDDGDGSPASEDCDDADASIYPGADEVCDGVDNDCDGLTDDEDDDVDPSTGGTFYVDGDGDGFGDGDLPVEACALPDGAAETGDDCDDLEAAIHPDATEVCDDADADEDCSGDADDDDAGVDPSTQTMAWPDADGDGYGDAADPGALYCDPPSGVVTDDTDCDDTATGVHPGATEVCDGADVDEDCSGDADDDDAGVDPSTQTLGYPDADSDSYGDDTSSGMLYCDFPSGVVADHTDCDDGDTGINPGASEVCDASDTDEDCSGTADDADAGVETSTQTETWPDADSDGYGDSSASATLYCDPPSGVVTDGSDCDDAAPDVNPAATELCDGVDNDCDSTTSEDGVATWWDSAGTASDLTTDLTGTSSAPAAYTFSSAGTLAVCDGTWYTNLTIEADVDVYNPSGDETAVVLDGALTASAIAIDGDALSVTVSDLTLDNGAGSYNYSSSLTSGGNLDCSTGSTSGTTLLDLANVVLTGGDADRGGGLFSQGCHVTSEDLVIDSNTATFGGGVYLSGGTWDDVDGLHMDNSASNDAGDTYIVYASATMDGSLWDGGYATDLVGGVALIEADLTCTGTTSTAAGITGSSDAGDASDRYGQIYVGTASTFEAVSCDLGTPALGDDNDGHDLNGSSSWFQYEYGDDATFTCDDDACGAATDYTIGSSTYSGTTDGYARGFVIEATDTYTVDEFGIDLTINASGCSVDFYLMSNTSHTTTDWEVVWSDTVAPSSGDTEVSSGDVGLPLESGLYYAFVAGWDCNATYDYDYSTSSTSGLGTGTYMGGVADNNYTSYGTSGVTLNNVTSSARYHTTATTSH